MVQQFKEVCCSRRKRKNVEKGGAKNKKNIQQTHLWDLGVGLEGVLERLWGDNWLTICTNSNVVLCVDVVRDDFVLAVVDVCGRDLETVSCEDRHFVVLWSLWLLWEEMIISKKMGRHFFSTQKYWIFFFGVFVWKAQNVFFWGRRKKKKEGWVSDDEMKHLMLLLHNQIMRKIYFTGFHHHIWRGGEKWDRFWGPRSDAWPAWRGLDHPICNLDCIWGCADWWYRNHSTRATRGCLDDCGQGCCDGE